tara:strand:+ start:40 stop:531 length:492 start_codon:yes stop_codon:yes gene_type:complete
MIITVKNKNTLILDDFKFKCCVGKYGVTKFKIEGDKKTPKGLFGLGDLYFRKNKNLELRTKLKKISIMKNMGWCNDINNKKYNKLIKIDNKIKHEKIFRKDSAYDLMIPIRYNMRQPQKGKGSAIFLHLTKNYKKTLGCVALKKKDMLILIRLINKKTKIRIL